MFLRHWMPPDCLLIDFSTLDKICTLDWVAPCHWPQSHTPVLLLLLFLLQLAVSGTENIFELLQPSPREITTKETTATALGCPLDEMLV